MILKDWLFTSDSVMWAEVFLIQFDRVFQDGEHPVEAIHLLLQDFHGTVVAQVPLCPVQPGHIGQ